MINKRIYLSDDNCFEIELICKDFAIDDCNNIYYIPKGLFYKKTYEEIGKDYVIQGFKVLSKRGD